MDREGLGMDDLISRQAAVDIAKELTITIEGYEMHNQAVMNYCAEIMQLPPIQPKRGHWIEADVCGDTTSWECSCCHNWTGLPTGWNVKIKLWFCPKCTADMREVTT